MARKDACVEFVDELKIDKDAFVEKQWIKDYVHLVLSVCRKFGRTVLTIKKCRSRNKGEHFYIKIRPPVSAALANRLQWLLGDDAQRVSFNRARIRSRLKEWNKLFENVGRRLRTIYEGPD